VCKKVSAEPRSTIGTLLLACAALGVNLAYADAPPSNSVTHEPAPEFSDDPEDASWERVLRILVPSDALVEQLPPLKRDTHKYELELVKNFARTNLLVPVFEPVDRWEDLIPKLLSGKGQIIAANLRVTDTRKSKIAFTEPIHALREHLLVRSGDRVDSASDLEGREIAVREGSSFWNLIQDVRKEYPEIQVRIVPENTAQKILYEGVLQGRYDMAAVDLYAFQRNQEEWADLKLIPQIFEDDIIAWGTHPEAATLRENLNHFIRKAELARQPQSIYKADLPGIKQQKILRVLTRNNAVTYFIWRGRLMGFEYELLRKFAREQDLQLEMIIAPSREHLIPMLLWGGGDLVSASLTITEQRKTYGIEFTSPYNAVSEVVVARADDTELNHVSQLDGRTIWVRRSSSYWTTLERLRLMGHIRFILKAVPESMETEEIIDKVASGEYDLTVSYSHILDVALTWRDDVRAAFTIKENVKHGWAVRKEDKELLKTLNAFLEKEYRKRFYNSTYQKYFKNSRRIQQLVKFRADGGNGGELSPYDDLVQKYADEYGFDWPLIVALMYHESRFKKDAVSWAGARGLMQVLPVTAKRFGITDLEDPEKSIIAGMKMLDWLYDQFELELPVQERTWFTLASYNAGLGHVYDARELAKELKLDPDRWFDNVEVAMLKLSKPEYYSKATYGFVRGIEPVTYVRNIRDLYSAYIELLRGPLASN
jgi:membrane-bound lytic murein transglycosylase F